MEDNKEDKYVHEERKSIEIDTLIAPSPSSSPSHTHRRHASPIKMGLRPNIDFSTYERFALFCAIGLASYIGAYLRIAVSLYKIWKIETNYTVMYTQILGCLIMGFIVKHKTKMFDEGSGFMMIVYTGISSGLCGSITTFSTWSMECNKNFFLQGDNSWGNDIGSCNAGRFFEFLVCLIAGVAIPSSALHFGYFLATFSPMLQEKDEKSISPSKPASNVQISNLLLLIPVCLFIVATILIVALPIESNNQWLLFTYTGVFAVVGAYSRYLLSHWNKSHFTKKYLDNFYIGTFIVNVFGTWLLALITVSKFFVDYNDTSINAVLFGLSNGFCGCLTTVSTFVFEIDSAPTQRKSYFYAISTNFCAQIGIILIFNVYAWTNIPTDVVNFPSVIDFCSESVNLCSELLIRINCPALLQINVGCIGDNNYISPNYTNFVGNCSCGDFTTQRQVELLIDSQIKLNITSSMVALWPNKESNLISDPTESYDLCLTYQNVCNHLFNRMGCPGSLRQVSSCSRKGLYHYNQKCTCGAMDVSDDRVHEVIVDTALFRGHDMTKYVGFITAQPLDFCSAYKTTCTKLLDHINCKPSMRVNLGCSATGNYTTFQGICMCGTFDASFRVQEDLYDAQITPIHQSLIVKLNSKLSENDVPKACDLTQIRLQYNNVFEYSITQNLTTSIINVPILSGNYTIMSLLNDTTAHVNGSSVTFSLSSGGKNLFSTETNVSPYQINNMPLDSCVDYSLSVSPQTINGDLCAGMNATFRLNPNNICPSTGLLPQQFDVCSSYTALCQSFLDKISCPIGLQMNQACSTTPSNKYPNGKVENLMMQCNCGTITDLSTRCIEVVIDTLLEESVRTRYSYIPQPQAPYTLIISSNAQKQLIYEESTSILPN